VSRSIEFEATAHGNIKVFTAHGETLISAEEADRLLAELHNTIVIAYLERARL
jgi:hypothetical protein